MCIRLDLIVTDSITTATHSCGRATSAMFPLRYSCQSCLSVCPPAFVRKNQPTRVTEHTNNVCMHSSCAEHHRVMLTRCLKLQSTGAFDCDVQILKRSAADCKRTDSRQMRNMSHNGVSCFRAHLWHLACNAGEVCCGAMLCAGLTMCIAQTTCNPRQSAENDNIK